MGYEASITVLLSPARKSVRLWPQFQLVALAVPTTSIQLGQRWSSLRIRSGSRVLKQPFWLTVCSYTFNRGRTMTTTKHQFDRFFSYDNLVSKTALVTCSQSLVYCSPRTTITVPMWGDRGLWCQLGLSSGFYYFRAELHQKLAEQMLQVWLNTATNKQEEYVDCNDCRHDR